MKNRWKLHSVVTGLLLILLTSVCVSTPVMAGSFAQQDGDLAAADTLFEEGVALFEADRPSDALAKFERALALYEEHGASARIAWALFHIAAVHEVLADDTAALDAYEKGLAIWQAVGDRGIEITILDKMAGIQFRLGWYDKALTTYDTLLALLVEIGAQAEEAITRLNIADIHEQLQQYEAALMQYQDALTILKAINDQEEIGYAQHHIGLVYEKLGRYDEALQAYQSALTVRQNIGDRAGESDTLNNVAVVYRRQSQYEKALDAYEAALAISIELGEVDDQTITRANIAAVYISQGQFNRAVAILQDILETVSDSTLTAGIHNNIAAALDTLGRYQEALEHYNEALTIATNLGNRESEATILSNIAAIYRKQGRYQEALTNHQKALAIHLAIKNRAGEGITRNNIAAAYQNLGRNQDALRTYQQTLTIRREIGDRAGEAATLSNIAVIYDRLERYEEALAMYQDALVIQKEIGDRSGEAATLHGIGLVYDGLEEPEKALRTYQEALAIRSQIGEQAGEAATYNNIGAIHVSLEQYQAASIAYQTALTITQTIGERAGQAAVLENIGALYKKREDVSRAIDSYRESIDVIESIQRELRVEELKTTYAGDQARTYERLIDLLWDTGQTSDTFAYIQRARARAFLDQIGNQQIKFRQGAAVAMDQEEQTLHEKILGLQNALVNEQAKPFEQQNQMLLEDLQADLEQARTNYAELLIQLKLLSPEYAALISVDPLTLDDIQEQVSKAQVTLVEYFVMADYTLAIVLDGDQHTILRLNVTRNELLTQIAYLRELIADRDFDADIAANLHETLFAPLRSYIHHTDLIIIPHGPLHYLPFALLQDAADGHYLLHDYTITYAPTASALKFIQQTNDMKNERLLVMGNPDGSLAAAEREANAVAQLYGVTPLTQQQAVESRIHTQVKQVGLLHLAAHGVFNPFNPLFTRIELAPDAQQDGNLDVHEIYELDLRGVNLAVLSACNTALGSQSNGDELVGLTRAFLSAGVSSVVTSLWTVDDESTAYLMTQFYTLYRGGMGVAAALRQAQLDTMVEYPEPYDWAAFTLHGDGGWAAVPAVSVQQTTEAPE